MIPNIGNSSRWGQIVGGGYYWAISRSYDATYRGQWFTERGLAHNVEVRGKPTQRSDFNAVLFGVSDQGRTPPGSSERIKEGGYQIIATGYAELPWGFQSRGELNYLSSFVFRQAFTQTFNEAVFSEVHSVGFATRHWSANALNIVFERGENYQTTDPGDRIVIRKLPSVEYNRRDTKIAKSLPLWWSLESSAGLVRRNQPLFQTRQFVERIDFAPRVMTAVRWKDFSLLPYFSLRETQYGSSFRDGAVSGDGILRSAADAGAELLMPSLARVYDGPRWLGEKVKHVIEPRAGFRWVRGVGDFSRILRFDELDLLANTRELDYSLTQRLYAKRNGVVHEVWSWEVRQMRFFDPGFGGAVVEGSRNVLASQIGLSGYTFLDTERRYSPVASSMRINPTPTLGVEWRTDYDPLRKRITNSGILGNFRRDKLFVSGGHYQVRSSPVLTPSANQLLALIGYGRTDMRGWSTGFTANYDFRENRMQFATTQVTYNSDCCGLSFQYRRFNFGTRQENQFRVAFAIANIGSFGTLRLQERLF